VTIVTPIRAMERDGNGVREEFDFRITALAGITVKQASEILFAWMMVNCCHLPSEWTWQANRSLEDGLPPAKTDGQRRASAA
jgi:hypothetical protein